MVALVDPQAVLRSWFDAHARGDLARARSLMAPDATVRVPGATLRGFDEAMAWVDARRDAMPGFRYDVVDLLGGEGHAAAVIRLSDSSGSWRQVAVYEIEGGVIRSMTAYEDEREPDRA